MTTSEPSPGKSESAPTPHVAPQQTGLTSGPLRGLSATLLAAVVTLGVVAALFPWSQLPEHLEEVNAFSPMEEQQELQDAYVRITRTDGIAMLAIFSAIAAMALTVIEGLAIRRSGKGVGLGVLGLFIGAATAVVGGLVGAVVLDALWQNAALSPMAVTVITQMVMFGILGIGIGFSPALLHGRVAVIITAAAGGLLGGGLAGLLVPILTSFVLPAVNTEVLIPADNQARVCMVLVLAVMIGLTVGGIGSRAATAKH